MSDPVLDTAVVQIREALRGPRIDVAVADTGASLLFKKYILL